ncbi:hypothetical protein ACJIZ3_009755 [Penstemon smallii]|uniref:Heat stress transcription factor n=1 Tax=Penstemon smallii TaxID=265156 RepID=A0ABD3TDE7_9LAMI
MDGGASAAVAAAGGGGPAPFLLKTYEMVDDTTTDAIVSWSGNRKSFVVWNPPEFSRILLPSYFKHNNFSSFIRQLNTYGFRKIDPERWEFANEEFIKDQKHLLKNIHRRKPIHSHSQPQGPSDSERSTYEEEIDKLSREKAELESNLSETKEQNSTAKSQLENLTQRVGSMEQRQDKLLTFLEKAVQNRDFVELLAQKLESMDLSAYNKKRRLPLDSVNVPFDNQSSSISEFGFCNNLRLELSPAFSDVNLLSNSTQSSNEDGIRTGSFLNPPDTLELSDTGASFTLTTGLENQKLQNTLTSNDEEDGHISCLLDLTLASSSPLELNKNRDLTETPLSNREIRTETRPNIDSEEIAHGAPIVEEKATGQNRVNDVFWEQFLTERPGCSDTEEASSFFRANRYDEQEERKSMKGVSRNTKGMEHLTL